MNEISVISSDDIVLSVDFFSDNGDSFYFSDETKAEMLLHIGNQTEKIEPVEYKNNSVKFYLSGTDTRRLYNLNPNGVFYICIKVIFPDGTQNTPVYRKPFFIERC